MPTKKQTIINKESKENSDNNEPQIAQEHSLDETHIVTARGLSTKKFQPECINKESSTEHRS